MKIIVTGAASGIGRAAASRLCQEAMTRDGDPASIMIVDISPSALDETAAKLKASGARVETFVGDLANPAVPSAIIAATEQAFGGLNVLVSNAGIIKATPLLDLSVEDYDRTFAVNTRATWLLAKAAHPLLKASKGCIIATASISAEEPTPPLGAYSASKAALVMLIRQLACDWGPDGIRCNCVSPGSTHTGMTDARYSNPELKAAAEARNPLRMIGEPEHHAAAIAFLASPDAAYTTGANLVIDGGARTSLMTMAALGNPWAR